jgi:NAD(P)-dependent dehydrogenase (short-subunit alcohol dehydrogenase family)
MHVAITGAATGIGAEVVSRLKNQGHSVTALDIIEVNQNVDQFIKLDLSDLNSINSAVNAAKGPFDALINNAGLPPRKGLEEKILMVNYIGMQTFMNGMLDNLANGASIVNTSSRAGAMWQENLNQIKNLRRLNVSALRAFISKENIDPVRAYNLSKEAIIVLTIARTEELLTRGFRINSICPAAVSTGILKDFTNAFGEKVVKNIARAGRAALPGEVADSIIYLASPQSAWIKGQNITIDGGMSAMIMTDTLELNN